MNEKELIIYTNTIIGSELLVNYLEELKETPIYRQRLKNISNSLIEELEQLLIREFPKIYNLDEEFIVNLMREYKDLLENITVCGGNDLIVIGQLIKEYKLDRDKFLNKFKITLKKIDE
jgi:hypothetical protein